LSINEFSEATARFESMDLNHDGVLSMKEWHKAFGGLLNEDILVRNELTKLFYELDVDSSGFLSFREFMLGR
jgi:Ca2+-binding EF-hand superfamily protein